jgi:hypothetical protein
VKRPRFGRESKQHLAGNRASVIGLMVRFIKIIMINVCHVADAMKNL